MKPQDTLYSIAWRNGVDFRDLARWNHIGPDFRIAVGQVLRLSPSARAPPLAAGKNIESPDSPKPPVASGPSSLSWAWPTDRISAPQPSLSGGIILLGREGQDIRAASSGRVVYTGTGIRGYGNLIIIKHGENLLSAYAHNRDSLVRDGQEVTLGQVIGHMGEGAPQKPALYFEIRRSGKPVDPLVFLPTLK
ncbi:MAG TPA: peptidoglycan DD-metalloendopeptidase family protein [Steroidobacteraceae bacterium]